MAVVAASMLVAFFLGTGPASAHSDLESATPAIDSTVTELPDVLQLTFSDGVQPGFAQIAVLDPSGADVVTAEPAVEGDVVTQPVAMTEGGDYGVSYRIVSADGHTIQGTYGFSWAPAAAPSTAPATPTASAPASVTAPAPSDAAPSDGDAGSTGAAASAPDDSGSSTGFLIGVVALAVAAAAVGFVLVRRRRA